MPSLGLPLSIPSGRACRSPDRRVPTVSLLAVVLALCACDGGEDMAPPGGTGGGTASSIGGAGAGASAGGTHSGGTGAGAAGVSGGVPGTGGSAGAGETPVPADFELIFEDEFETLDLLRWETASHTFDENASVFAASQVSVQGGKLVLTLDHAAAGEKPYVSGELRSKDWFSYGRFETRARFTAGSGVVSSVFTYYDHWSDPTKAEDWNEIDVEFLGNNLTSVQFNVVHWNALDARTTHEQHFATGFDPSADFHDYAIEWIPGVVNFYVDGVLAHSQTDQIAEFLTLDQRLMMNVWPVANTPDLNAWAGAFDAAILPATAEYEWVRAYKLVAAAP